LSRTPSGETLTGLEETPGGVDVFALANVWAWGEVIEIRFFETSEGTQISATCRPWLATTLFDYGQSVKDLDLFVVLLRQQTESAQRGDGP